MIRDRGGQISVQSLHMFTVAARIGLKRSRAACQDPHLHVAVKGHKVCDIVF